MSDYEVTRIDQFVYSLTHFFLFSYFDRVSFEDVVKKTKWQKTLNDEIDVIKKNHTWEPMALLKRQKIINVKWVYKTVEGEYGSWKI